MRYERWPRLAARFAGVLTLVGGDALAAPAPAVPAAECRVTEVLAAKEGDGAIPPELKFIEAELKDEGFAAYKGFRRLEVKALTLTQGSPGAARFATGQIVKLDLVARSGKKLKLRFRLVSDPSGDLVYDTDYTIDDNGLIIFVGPRRPDGRLLFVPQCRGRKS
jgi:hypothetical protein